MYDLSHEVPLSELSDSKNPASRRASREVRLGQLEHLHVLNESDSSGDATETSVDANVDLSVSSDIGHDITFVEEKNLQPYSLMPRKKY